MCVPPKLSAPRSEAAARRQLCLLTTGALRRWEPAKATPVFSEAGIEYLRRLRELRYHETLFELLAKELAIGKLDEAREGEIVVDPGVPPEKK